MTIEEYLGEENTLGQDIWHHKYQYKEENFEQWLDRISNGNEALRKLLIEKRFLFAGRILANRGLYKDNKKITYSNCYVTAAPEDNIESIFDTAKSLARTYSYGGGCGVDIGNLRPVGATVNNAAETTSGSVSFMNLYSMVTELIGQSGRRGALMISIPCDHPDLETFINIKSDLTKVTKANISVRITNEFMEAVRNHDKYNLHFEVKDTDQVINKEVDAYTIFSQMADMNWDYAEPGMLFWDRIEHWNLLANTKDFEFAGTNPCAEEPLPAGGSCLLGAINLSLYVTKDQTFDHATFENDVKTAVTALNEVLDEGLPLHPLQEQRDSVRDWRQIGLGIFGLADLLIKLGIRYGSEEAVALSNEIGFTMANTAIYQSAKLASKLGAYPKCSIEDVMTTPYFIANTTPETVAFVKKVGGLRNSQLLTIAPTGTISTMLGISGGMEPIYAFSYNRVTQSLHGEDVSYKVYTSIVQDYMEREGLLEEEELPDYFVAAKTLNYHERILMQSTWQNHIDASISSTVNVPFEFSKEEVRKLYFEAWEMGLKGITIYRDGCKRTGILTESNTPTDSSGMKRGEILKVSDDFIGKKRTLYSGCGTLHCEAFFDPNTGELMETFLSKGSKGGCNSFMVGLSRMISIAARGGISIDDIVDQLESTLVCPSYVLRRATHHDTSPGSSCPIAIGRALMEMYHETQNELEGKIEKEEHIPEIKKPITISPEASNEEGHAVLHPCPVCGAELAFEGGCNSCKSCGYSKCE